MIAFRRCFQVRAAPAGKHRAAIREPPAPREVSGGRMAGVLDHVGMQCTDLVASAAFYDAVLVPLGGQRIMDFGSAIGYGIPPHADFWISAKETGDGFAESHLAFIAPSRAAVRAFFDVAVAEGASVLHQPRLWPEYHATYFGAFVRDPDGNNIEAVCHLPE
jgi:catechol 2,3-dioxygenase-like lactoylglutathione lyase family enzyme